MESHKKYFELNARGLPYHYTGSEASRMTLAYFCLSGLDILDALDEKGSEEQQGWVEWIYAQQVVSQTESHWSGFRGGPCLGDGSVEVSSSLFLLSITF